MSRGRLLKIAGVLVGAALLIALVRRGYEQSWTGFGAYIGAEGKTVPPKYLWDWLSLLIVPLFLAVAAWALNNSRKAADARTAARAVEDFGEREGFVLSDWKPNQPRPRLRIVGDTI